MKKIVFALVSVLFLCGFINPSHATRCDSSFYNMSAEEAWDIYDLIFLGTVINVDKSHQIQIPEHEITKNAIVYEFLIEQVFKGNHSISRITQLEEGFFRQFKEGHKYIVFAKKNIKMSIIDGSEDYTYTVNICSPTRDVYQDYEYQEGVDKLLSSLSNLSKKDEGENK